MGTLVFKSGKSADDLSIVKTMEVDSKFAGWLTCFLADSDNHLLAVEIKGNLDTWEGIYVFILTNSHTLIG